MARRKNGRFTRQKKTRSRRKKTFNLGKAAETALVANAAIGGLFGTNLPTFLTGKNMLGGFDTTRPGENNSWEITVPELFSLATGGSGGIAKTWEGGIGSAISKNLKDRGGMALVQMIAIPFAFKVGRRVLSKPLINPTNRALRSMGIKEVRV